MGKEEKRWQFNNYNSLCERAREIIFYELAFNQKDKNVFEKLNISDNLVKLTPIEQILFIALCLYPLDNKDFEIKIWIQKQINAENKLYVADFCIDEIKKDNKWYLLNNPIVIECDGFDYHSSKVQLAHDYEREQKLKLSGYDVIRFTGSQIYNNPENCSYTIYKYIKTLIDKKQYKEIQNAKN